MNMQSLYNVYFIMTKGTSQKYQDSVDSIQVIHALILGSFTSIMKYWVGMPD